MPAFAAAAILLAVILVGVVASNDSSSDGANSPTTTVTQIVMPSSTAPVTKLPLTQTYGRGAAGPEIKLIQDRLIELKFDPGVPDGAFGERTQQAVWAFEKLVMSTPRERATGVVTPSTWSIMQSDIQIKPRRDADTVTHVEVYLPEQVMIVFADGAPRLITHMSSGSNENWCEEVTIDPGEDGNNTNAQIKQGICGEAITPPGIFYFYNRRVGMRESKLGTMYNPVYFNYNVAIHGAILVPLKP